MKTKIINILSLIAFVAICLGIAYVLPLKAAIGVVILLQVANLLATATGSITNNRKSDGKA